MTDRQELDARLLAEARARDQGRILRRFVFLIAAALIAVILGIQGDEPVLAVIVAVGLVAFAVWQIRH